MQPTPQDNQLMSKHDVFSFKPQLWASVVPAFSLDVQQVRMWVALDRVQRRAQFVAQLLLLRGGRRVELLCEFLADVVARLRLVNGSAGEPETRMLEVGPGCAASARWPWIRSTVLL
jgi:hypothetical protein